MSGRSPTSTTDGHSNTYEIVIAVAFLIVAVLAGVAYIIAEKTRQTASLPFAIPLPTPVTPPVSTRSQHVPVPFQTYQLDRPTETGHGTTGVSAVPVVMVVVDPSDPQ